MQPSSELTTPALPVGPQAWARYANLVLGAWLVISAFSWRHVPPTRTNTWTFGIIIIVATLATLHTAPARWIDRTAAIGLVILTLPLARFSLATAANNILVAALLIAVSLSSSRGARAAGRVPRETSASVSALAE
jgi:hypothetical protein